MPARHKKCGKPQTVTSARAPNKTTSTSVLAPHQSIIYHHVSSTVSSNLYFHLVHKLGFETNLHIQILNISSFFIHSGFSTAFKRQTMETTSIAHHHPLLRLPSDKADRFSNKFHLGVGDLRVSDRPRRCFGRLTSRFSDSGHQRYYVSSRSDTEKQEKEKSCEIKSVKKKLKLIERLSTDLSSFSLLADGKKTGNNLMDEAKISDAAELLQAQLQQLRLEQKDLKRKMKEEKARHKTTLKQSKCKSDSSSSSSSSESSDRDCGEVTDRKQSKYSQAQKVLELVGRSSLIQQDKYEELVRDERESCCSSSNGCHDYYPSSSISDRTANKRIEICMGGKCKKAGAEDLLEEFKRKVGAEDAVLGCKCMGKCKNGPNLRVSDTPSEFQATRSRSSIDSICIGVGLRDVEAILANIFAKDANEKSLMAPA